MNSIFANWKTSLAGGAALITTVLTTVIPVLPPQYAVVANGVLAGLGLLFAQDGKSK